MKDELKIIASAVLFAISVSLFVYFAYFVTKSEDHLDDVALLKLYLDDEIARYREQTIQVSASMLEASNRCAPYEGMDPRTLQFGIMIGIAAARTNIEYYRAMDGMTIYAVEAPKIMKENFDYLRKIHSATNLP